MSETSESKSKSSAPDSVPASKPANNPAKKLGRGPAAAAGLAIAFLIALLVNFLVGKFSFRADITENKVYTLTEGTRAILGELETPVTVRYYVTDSSDVMSPSERAQARRVTDLLNEYVRNAPAKEVELVNDAGEFETKKVKMLKVEKLNPEPNTDAEDAAIIDGLQAGASAETNNELYFGIAVECLDQQETLPFLPARPETELEYDLSRAISNVHGGKAKKITVMTSLPVGGGFSGNFQAPPQQPWFFYEQLGQDYEMETIAPDAAEIPEDTSTLIVLHPHDITEEGQFAIDQYLLKGGNVIVALDPNFFYARALAQGQPQIPGAPPQGGPPPSSDLDKLLGKWGVSYDANRVLADLDFGSEIIRRGNFSPTFLTLDSKAMKGGRDDGGTSKALAETAVKEAKARIAELEKELAAARGEEGADQKIADLQARIDQLQSRVREGEGASAGEDRITAMLDHLNMLTPGAFEIDPPAGIRVDPLVQTSTMNQLVSSFDADPTQEGGGDRIREDFQPFGKRRYLVARLSGDFTTAFPEGDPAAAAEEEEEEEDDAGSEKAAESDKSEASDVPVKQPAKKGGAADAKSDNKAVKGKAGAAKDKAGKTTGKKAAKAGKPAKKAEEKATEKTKRTEKQVEKTEEASGKADAAPDPSPEAEGNDESEGGDEAEPESAETEGDADTAAEEEERETDTGDGTLKSAVAPGRVLLIADVDFLYDANVVQRNQVPGLGIEIPQLLNENLVLLQNAAEQMSGDPNLINVRSRSSVRRPFTRQNEWQREAQEKYQAELTKFQDQAEETTNRINAILAQTPENAQEALMSPEVQAELKGLQEQQVEFRRNARELEKEVTREFRRKLATFKFGNALFMPVLVIVFGIGLAIFRKAKTAAR